MPFCLKLTKIWRYIRTCTKTCIAICFRKSSVYRNGLYIRVCNSRNIVSVSLCLVPFKRRQIVLSRKVWHLVVAYMWRKLWSYLHSYLNNPHNIGKLSYNFKAKSWLVFLDFSISIFQNIKFHILKMSRYMRFLTMWYVRPAKPQISLRIITHSLIRAFDSCLNILWLLRYWPNIIWSF